MKARWSALASRLLATGKPADALIVAKQIAQDVPKSLGATSLLARAYRANGQRVEAIQALSKAIELSPTPRGLLLQMEEMRELSTLEKASK